MGRQVKVNRDRIDFGEQGQATTLTDMIKKLDEHEKIRKIRNDLDAAAQRQQSAYDGQEIPDSDDQTDDQNPKPAVIDKYLDEDIRKTLLVSSTKDKQRVFRERRQQFELHRKLQDLDRDSNSSSENEIKNYASDSGVARQTGKHHDTAVKSKNPYRKKEKPLRQMITTVNVAR